MAIKFKHTDDRPLEQANYAPTKRHIPKWQWYLLMLILISPIAYFMYKIANDKLLVGAPGYITFKQITIRAPNNGYLASIAVAEGSAVTKGQLLSQFISPELNKTLASLKEEIVALETIKQQNHHKNLEHLHVLKNNAEVHLAQSQTHYAKIKKLHERGLISMIELHEAWNDLNDAKTQLSTVQHQIKSSQQQYHSNMEGNYNQKIRKMKHEIEKLKTMQELFKLKSPSDGTVNKVLVHANEYISTGQTLFTITSDNHLYIKAFLNAKYITKVKKQQQVTIKLPGRTDIVGTVIDTPHYAKAEPNPSQILKRKGNKIVLLIRPNARIPDQYRVHNLTVKIEL